MAHNTVMIDEREQAELWGEHRAARKISAVECQMGDQVVLGRFRSFYKDRFERSIRLTEASCEITDRIAANDRQRHCARQFFHLDPRCHYSSEDSQQIRVCDADKTLALISIPPGSSGLIHREGDICCYAQDFGELRKKEVLEVRTRFEQSAEIQIHIELL